MERFKNFSDTEIEELLDGRDSQSTKRVIQLAVRILGEYLATGNVDISDISALDTVTTTELSALLRKFYADLRKGNGDYYAKKSMISVRFGLQRHFLSKRSEDIINDPQFKGANDVFKAVLVRIAKLGAPESKHKQPITPEDIDKLYHNEVFSVHSGTGLLNRTFFEFLYYFCKRGGENLRSIKKSDFEVRTDSQGKRYVVMKTEHQTKNHRGDDIQNDYFSQARMYEIPGDERCPVSTFEKYMSKLNPNINEFWQRPKKDVMESSPVWFDAVPLGKNTLCALMSKINEQASLSQTYTNHCVRATCITNLDQHGVESRHIIGISGHKSETSLKSYSSKLSDNKKRDISKILSESTKCVSIQQNVNRNEVQQISKTETVTCSQLSEVDFLDDETVNQFLCRINDGSFEVTENLQTAPLSASVPNIPCPEKPSVPHGLNVFNSTVHVHYYN